MRQVTRNNLIQNEDGQAILLMSVTMSAVLVGIIASFMQVSGTHGKQTSTRVSQNEALLSASSLSKLMADGSYCAMALLNQTVSNQSTQVALNLPGDSTSGNQSSVLAQGQTQPGTSLEISSVTLTPTSWPGTSIAFTGSPSAVTVPATLAFSYNLNMEHNLGSPAIAGNPINLNLILNSPSDPRVVGCIDPLAQSCANKGRAVNPIQISPLTRQTCEQVVAQQIDNGDAIAPATMRCGLSTKNNVYCWGGAVVGQAVPTAPQTEPALMSVLNQNVTQVASSAGHSCAVMNGSLYCWGSNEFGETGPGPNPQMTPTLVPNLPGTVIKVATAGSSTCALVNNGTNQVWCWGGDTDGEVAGSGTTSNLIANPTNSGLTNVTDLVGRWENYCAIKSDGTLWCWGSNGAGILEGVGSFNGGPPLSPTPVQITGLAGPISSVTIGTGHACVLLASGQVQCWGINSSGQFGNGTTTFPGVTSLPGAVVTGLNNAVQVSAGDGYTCAVDSTSAVQCWGANQYGVIGPNPGQTTPFLLTGLTTGVAEVQTGSERTCARMACGQVRCLGNNQFGNLGDGTTNNSNVPVIAKTFAGNGCPP